MENTSNSIFRLFVGAFLVSQLGACGTGATLFGANLAAPTINNAPTATNQANLSVTGTKPTDTSVWAIYDNGTQTQLAASDSTGTWTAPLPLQQGQNNFVLVAKKGTTGASGSNAYTILLDQVAPNTPSVSYPQAALVQQGQQTTVTISGTKSPDGNVEINGNVVVPADGSATWSATVTVSYGQNTFSVSSVDAVGNVSGTTTFNIYGSAITPPTINPYKSPTNQAVTTLTGTKGAGTNLFVVVNGGTEISVGTLSATTWTYTFTLPQQGTNVISFYAKDPTQPTEFHSQSATATIVLKSTPPAAPTIILPNPFPGEAETSNPSITVTVDLPPDGYLCVSHQPPSSPNVVCFVTSDPNALGGQNVAVTIPLYGASSPSSDGTAGSNTIYLSSEDLAGNFSSGISGTIYRDSPPTLQGLTPANGAVFVSTNPSATTQTVPVSFTAIPNPADSGHAAATVTGVSVSVDGGPTIMGTGSSFSNNVTLNNPTNSSEHTLTITVTNEGGGVTKFTTTFIYSNGSAFMISNDTDTNASMVGAVSPQSVFDNAGNLHVVWEDYCHQSASCTVNVGQSIQPPDIFYRWRNSSGAWSNIQVVSSTGPDDGQSLTPSIAVDSQGNVHVAWADTGSTNGKPSDGASAGIEHRVIVPSNGNFVISSHIDIIGNPNLGVSDVNPSLAADSTSGNVYLAWGRPVSGTRNNIMFSQSPAGNGNWASTAPVTVVTTNPNTGSAGLPDVAAAGTGNSAVVSWQDCNSQIINPVNTTQNLCNSNWPNSNSSAGSNYDIYLATVTGGTSASAPILVTNKLKTNGQDGQSRAPSIFVDPNQTTWVFWLDDSTIDLGSQGYTTQRSNVWLAKYKAATQVQGYTLVSTDPNQGTHNASNPSATIGRDGAVAAVWQLNEGISDGPIWGAFAANYTQAMTPIAPISTTPVQTGNPWVALDGTSTNPSNLHVVWPQNGLGSASSPLFNIVYDYVPNP